MAMAWIWTAMVALSVLCGVFTGRMDAVGAAALEGAAAAVDLCVGMLGGICLWMGVMELMERCGLAAGLSRLFRPVLRRLLPLLPLFFPQTSLPPFLQFPWHLILQKESQACRSPYFRKDTVRLLWFLQRF